MCPPCAEHEPVRVVHVTPYFAPAFRYGGPPRSVLGLCHGLSSAGVAVEVVTTSADGDGELPRHVTERNDYEGIPVSYVSRRFPRRFFGARGFASALRPTLERSDLAHLHGLWSYPVWVGSRECLRASVPFVVSPRGMLDGGSLAHRRWRKELSLRLWQRASLEKAALLHATSESEKARLERMQLGPDVVLVPNGVMAPPPARIRSGEPPFVLYLGRLHPTKRLDLLLDAFERVVSQHPHVKLVIAGPPDGVQPEALLSRTRARERVSWVGEVSSERKWELLTQANALVLCSDSESFGVSVVEAMAMGVPVVVTRTCPWREVETARCGFWVNQSADAVASALDTILKAPDESRAMGERGRALVEKRYRWPAIGPGDGETLRPRHRNVESLIAVRYVLLTPCASGRDGVSRLTRQMAVAVGGLHDTDTVEVWSLNDATGEMSSDALAGARVRGADRLKGRFIAWSLTRAFTDCRDTTVFVLHLHLSPLSLPLGARGARVFQLLLGIEAWKPMSYWQSKALSRAEKVISISRHSAELFSQFNPGQREAHVCHPGLPRNGDVGYESSVPAFALTVGRMSSEERYKGHDALIEMWPSIRQTAPDASLVVVGDGDDRDRLVAKARALGLEDAIRFTGAVPDDELERLYNQCAFFVMPSRNEGFGLVFLEAMRAGKACIGGAGASAEIIDDGVTGFVVDARDVPSIERAVQELFRNSRLRETMGRRGAERFEHAFTADHFHDRLASVVTNATK